jgi:hypothetical protein
MNATISRETPIGGCLKRLVGWRVRVPTKSNPQRHWWVTVREQNGPFLLVSGNASAGKWWWTHVDKITSKSKPANAKLSH